MQQINWAFDFSSFLADRRDKLLKGADIGRVHGDPPFVATLLLQD